MGRRRNNPELVEELIDEIWDMDQNEWEEKYNSLSSSDQDEVMEWVNRMESQGNRRLTMFCEY